MLAQLQDPSQLKVEHLQGTDKWEATARKILNNIWRMRGGYLFHQPVDPVRYNILDYTDIIKHPMDFGTVKFKMNNCLYARAEQFIQDMKLVFDNCVLYNGINTEVGKIGADLYEEFIAQCQKESLAKDYDYYKHSLAQPPPSEDHQVFLQDHNN